MDFEAPSRSRGTIKASPNFRDPRIVVIKKVVNQSLGFNIVGGESGEGIYISFLVAGGAADSTGQLQPGDRILAVDGFDLRDATHEDAVQRLKQAGEEVHLLVVYRMEEYKRYEARMADADAPAVNGALHNATSPATVRSTATSRASSVSANCHSHARCDSSMSWQSQTLSVRTTAKKSVYVRAQFEYDANHDAALPSRGLTFSTGCVLHVLNASDDEWWQARLVVPSEARDFGPLGIVPSRRRIERRERARLKRVNFDSNRDKMQMCDGAATVSGTTAKDCRKSLRKLLMKGSSSSSVTSSSGAGKDASCEVSFAGSKKISGSVRLSCSDTEADELKAPSHSDLAIRSYEAVTCVELTYTRPIVILGPAKERVIENVLKENPDRFAPCVPHTSRPAREHEVDGRDYHFVVNRGEMQQQIDTQHFVEAGQYNGHLYGTSVAAVRQVAESGRHCMLDVSCNAIKRLHTAGLYPIAILVKPRDIAWIVETSSRRVSEQQALMQLDKCSRIEKDFGDLLTSIITGAGSFDQLMIDIKRTIREHSGRFIWLPSNEPI